MYNVHVFHFFSLFVFFFCSQDKPLTETKHRDYLTDQVNQLLKETAYLTGSSRNKDKENKENDSAALDYDRLNKDLQEIQDSLQMGEQKVYT